MLGDVHSKVPSNHFCDKAPWNLAFWDYDMYEVNIDNFSGLWVLCSSSQQMVLLVINSKLLDSDQDNFSSKGIDFFACLQNFENNYRLFPQISASFVSGAMQTSTGSHLPGQHLTSNILSTNISHGSKPLTKATKKCNFLLQCRWIYTSPQIFHWLIFTWANSCNLRGKAQSRVYPLELSLSFVISNFEHFEHICKYCMPKAWDYNHSGKLKSCACSTFSI